MHELVIIETDFLNVLKKYEFLDTGLEIHTCIMRLQFAGCLGKIYNFHVDIMRANVLRYKLYMCLSASIIYLVRILVKMHIELV